MNQRKMTDEEMRAHRLRKAMQFGETYGMRGSLSNADNVERQSQATTVFHPVGLFKGMDVNCIHDSVEITVPMHPESTGRVVPPGYARVDSLRERLESKGFNVVGISPTPSRLDIAKCIVPDFSAVELRVLAELNELEDKSNG